MEMVQTADQAIDIADWHRHEEFSPYPEGARAKTLVYSPSSSPYKFLKSNYRYLFKRSSHRYPDQYWVEIIAHLLGTKMQISVPPTFVAYDSKENLSAALSEWFIPNNSEYIRGGDFFAFLIPNFDRKKGLQHNFETIKKICKNFAIEFSFETAWRTYWAKTFLFDALIGNTDRHQNNWGVICTIKIDADGFDYPSVERLSPVFDNGTSMGHEIYPQNFSRFENCNYLANYVNKGRHHMKWNLKDNHKMQHNELLQRFILEYPEQQETMLNCLKNVNSAFFKKTLDNLQDFNIPVKLSKERANFILRLLDFRHQKLLQELE